MTDAPWICCQLGSREHYAIPRILHRNHLLSLLLTDFWSRRPEPLRRLPFRSTQKLSERCHRDLNTVRIEDLGVARLAFDLRGSLSRWRHWELLTRRNQWFQRKLLERLKRNFISELKRSPPGIFFAYSYAAEELFHFFKEFGWTTILGQIDPGVHEEELVAREKARRPEFETSWTPAPAEYWRKWKEELDLADAIIVNSDWSRQALSETHVPDRKIHLVPLAYENRTNPPPIRAYPKRFDSRRPLRVLFLGLINLRKGLSIILDSIDQLKDEPIEFWMVGPTDVRIPDRYLTSSKVKWPGAVARSGTDRYYREADVFLLPTLSDGFALTQLESQAHRLPVIASRFCGEVVKHGQNGYILDPLNADTLTRLLRSIVENSPDLIREMSQRSGVPKKFSLESLGENLLQVAQQTRVAQTSR